MLILVEGILSGGNLIGALAKKVELTNPDKLIYSGHIYPFRYRIRISDPDPVFLPGPDPDPKLCTG